MKATTVFALIVGMAACGGGGGGDSAQTVPVTQPAVTKHVIVRQYGDSTTSGLTYQNGAYVVAKQTSADRLYVDLQAQFGGAVTVDDQGVPSTCAENLLNGDGVHAPFAQEIQTTSAQIITFNFGMNDGWWCHRTVDQYAADMGQLIDIARAAGKTVVLEEPNPTTSPDNLNLDAYVAALRSVAADKAVPLVAQYDYIKTVSNWQSLLSDGTHPTIVLYAIKGDREAQVIAPIVSQLLK
jgi:lysophospholipase L1-like esterase